MPPGAAPPARRANARYTVLEAPGPLPADMLRSLPAIRRDPVGFLARTVERHGPLVAFPLPKTPVLLVNTPAGARRVLVEGAGTWTKQTVQYSSLALVTGSGLLTTDGSAWRDVRRAVQPAFGHGSLDVVAEQAVAAAERVRSGWPDGAPVEVDVDAAALRATLEVVGRTLFGGDVGDDGERVVAAVLQGLHVVVARARNPVPVPRWLPTPGNRRLARTERVLDEAVAHVVERRRAAGVGAEDGDMLALLLRAVDAGVLGADDVRGEVATMVVAGHETVASSLAWTLHLLSQHPGAQERLHAELDAVLRDGAGGVRAPTWSDLRELTWTRAVVDESLRLYPPAWVVTRRAERDDVVDGVAVPAGTLVIISPWLLHRRPDTYAGPERFEPERFLDQSPPSPSRGEYLPFGAGARLCIGRDFALVETVLVLAALLRDRAVSPPQGRRRPVRVDALVTLRPRGGLPLRFSPRSLGSVVDARGASSIGRAADS